MDPNFAPDHFPNRLIPVIDVDYQNLVASVQHYDWRSMGPKRTIVATVY